MATQIRTGVWEHAGSTITLTEEGTFSVADTEDDADALTFNTLKLAEEYVARVAKDDRKPIAVRMLTGKGKVVIAGKVHLGHGHFTIRYEAAKPGGQRPSMSGYDYDYYYSDTAAAVDLIERIVNLVHSENELRLELEAFRITFPVREHNAVLDVPAAKAMEEELVRRAKLAAIGGRTGGPDDDGK